MYFAKFRDISIAIFECIRVIGWRHDVISRSANGKISFHVLHEEEELFNFNE